MQKIGSCDLLDHLLLRMFCPYLFSRFYGYICKVTLGDKRNNWRHPRKPSYTARFIGDKVSFYVDIIGLSWWMGSWIKFRVTSTQHPDLTKFHVEPWHIPLQPNYLAHLTYMKKLNVSLNNPLSPSSLPSTAFLPFHPLLFPPVILTTVEVVANLLWSRGWLINEVGVWVNPFLSREKNSVLDRPHWQHNLATLELRKWY